VHRIELVDERARPLIEHVSDRHVVGDPEGEVQVGEAVAAVDGERANGGSGNHVLILLREPKQVLAKSLALLNGEHEARAYLGGVEWLNSEPGGPAELPKPTVRKGQYGPRAVRLLVARCEVVYTGRLTATLAEAVRLIVLKTDGSVLVHDDSGGYKPLNWICTEFRPAD
jgi:hypothetical protein